MLATVTTLLPLTAAAQDLVSAPSADRSDATTSTDAQPAPRTPPKDELPQWRYVVGLATSFAPDTLGASSHQWKARPLWAMRVGRVRIATSRAAALLAFATNEPPTSGASAELFSAGDMRLRAALRYDQGRDELGSVDQRPGLPEVRPTLRLRLLLSKPLATGFGASINVTQDILGRDQGATAGIDFGHSRMVGAATEWGASAGLTAANADYMQSHFGLTAEQGMQGGWAPHTPGAGLRDVHVSTGLTTALTPSWLAYTQLSVTRLLGPAAQSPLVHSALSTELTLGVAWRCCGAARP